MLITSRAQLMLKNLNLNKTSWKLSALTMNKNKKTGLLLLDISRIVMLDLLEILWDRTLLTLILRLK